MQELTRKRSRLKKIGRQSQNAWAMLNEFKSQTRKFDQTPRGNHTKDEITKAGLNSSSKQKTDKSPDALP